MRSRPSVRGCFKRALGIVLISCILLPAPAVACPAWDWCQIENKAHDVGKAAKDVVTGVADGAKKTAEGGVKILRGAAELATGHPGQAWSTIVDGGKEIISGVIQVAVTGTVVAVTGSVGFSWKVPATRENGDSLDITELGGYELRYRPAANANFTYITINDPWVNYYNFSWLVGDYVFQVAAFGKSGVYSNFVDITPL